MDADTAAAAAVAAEAVAASDKPVRIVATGEGGDIDGYGKVVWESSPPVIAGVHSDVVNAACMLLGSAAR